MQKLFFKCSLAFSFGLALLLFAPPSEAKLPRGDYQKSCQRCKVGGKKGDRTRLLTCWCRGQYGQYNNHVLIGVQKGTGCQKPISYCGGKLYCGSCTKTKKPKKPNKPNKTKKPNKTNENNLPPGSYKTSCKDCKVSNGILSCHCRRTDGSYNFTRGLLYDCKKGFYACNGTLLCRPCMGKRH